MICKVCRKRFGVEGVNYWSVKLSLCEKCKKRIIRFFKPLRGFEPLFPGP